MNLQCTKPLAPLRVLIVNPLASTSQLISVKILSGGVFGEDQSINLTLLVFSNEVPAGEAFKLELEKCAYACANSISVSSTVPSVTGADVFCFLANFPNPNCVDFERIETDEQFDNLYLMIKIANNFEWPELPVVKTGDDEKPISIKRRLRMDQEDNPKPVKPIFMADGLVVMDILHSMSRNMPRDVFFCPTPLTAIAKTVIGDHIKVQSDVINDVFIWAADDVTFHMEVERPMIRRTSEPRSRCDWELAGTLVMNTLSMEHTQFNASWMKKDCIERMKLSSMRNPYGCIYRAASFAQALRTVWSSRRPKCGDGDDMKVLSSLGVISDGSSGTYEGLPYTLPVIFDGEGWTVNECFKEDSHLRQEMKKINKAAKQHHARMLTHCKKFLHENVIKMGFVPTVEDTPSYNFSRSTSSRPTSSRTSHTSVEPSV